MKKVIIINGPNLNLLGKREPDVYGHQDFDSFYLELKEKYSRTIEIDYFQSNIEGEIVDKLQAVGFSFDGVILNAAAYTHTSVAIRDAISAINTEVLEIHISNVFAREDFRSKSHIAPVCKGSISGFGLNSYILGLEYFNLNQ